MKTLIAALCVLALTGCASTDGKQQGAATPSDKSGAESRRLAETAFEEAGGTLNLVFDAEGNWVRITAKGAAAMADDTPAGRETGLMIATMRAKQTVAEFLNNDIKSSKTLTRVARSYARAFQSEDSESKTAAMSDLDSDTMADLDIDGKGARTEKARKAQRFASILTERIQDNSTALLKGAYVSQRALRDGRVSVDLTITRQSVAAAQQVSGMMQGALQ